MNQIVIDFDAPLARQCDPATSHEASADTLPRLQKLHRQLLDSVSQIDGDFTAMEAARAAHALFPSANDQTYRKRTAELERAGLIRQQSIRRCRVTGKMARSFVSVQK